MALGLGLGLRLRLRLRLGLGIGLARLVPGGIGARESRVAAGPLEEKHREEASVVEHGVEDRDGPVSTHGASESAAPGVLAVARQLVGAPTLRPLLSVAAPQEPPAGEAVHGAVGLAEERPHATPPRGRLVPRGRLGKRLGEEPAHRGCAFFGGIRSARTCTVGYTRVLHTQCCRFRW